MMGAADLFTLEGKVAIVTGASVGLGACFAEAMAEAGADVVGADCQEKLLDETMERIGKLGRRVLAIPTDVTKEQDVKRMVETTVKEFGSLDIIINNAGIAGKSHPIHELSFEDWNRVVEVNLNGVFFCIREAAKVMIKQKRGKIINIASVWGLVGTSSVAPLPHYAATKGAVVNLTREAALEYAKYGMNVNAIAPGFFGGTQLASGMGVEDLSGFIKKAEAIIPTGKFGVASDLKGTAIYLASRASDAVTGHILSIDNGIAAW